MSDAPRSARPPPTNCPTPKACNGAAAEGLRRRLLSASTLRGPWPRLRASAAAR